MRYASLASGSKGNCHVLDDGERALLLDAGISFRQINLRLEGLGWPMGRIRAVAFTHEHTDHIHAVPMIIKHTDWAVMATRGTLRAIETACMEEVPQDRWIPLEPGRALDWEGWGVHPFSVSHDAVDPVGYRIEAGGLSLAVMTDLGYASQLAVEYARGLDLLVLESNHDVGMLREGPYPPALKGRILSRVGHLSNDACAEFLCRVATPALKNIVLAHLSEQNNDPALARLATASALGQVGNGTELHVAGQGAAFALAVG